MYLDNILNELKYNIINAKLCLSIYKYCIICILLLHLHILYDIIWADLMLMAWLLLEHVKNKLALHCVLDELLLADVSVSLLIHGVPAGQTIKTEGGGAQGDLMSETQTVTRSSSSSIPARRNRPITMSRISSTSMVPPPSVSNLEKTSHQLPYIWNR